jgi:NRAMP (natural resistance-associated macrophage protein)-like metal ion transporter
MPRTPAWSAKQLGAPRRQHTPTSGVSDAPQGQNPTLDGQSVDIDSPDIEGALGRVRVADYAHDGKHGLKRRLLTFLAIMGPGLVVMIGDNDAGGVATYAQAGQNYGYSLLWAMTMLIPPLIIIQEMVVRLAAITHIGHAVLITQRFGRFWGWFSSGDLFVLNFLTLVTEFIGVALALEYFHIDRTVSVPIAAAALITITVTGSFRRWERAMFVFLVINVLLVPLLWMLHPHYQQVARGLLVPGVQGGMSSDAVLLIIAIVGTTVAPWQLFFQHGNVIDKRITPRFLNYERADNLVGAFITQLGAVVFGVAGAVAVAGTPLAGKFTDALGVAQALSAHSHLLATFFAVLLLDASIVGAAAVTLSSSYAFGDMFRVHHSLHRRFSEAKPFYITFTLLVILAAAVVLIPHAALGLITMAVQALAGILLPAACAFLLLLCNDRQLLGPWVNPRWLNILSSLIIGGLLVLSCTLLITTIFPAVNTTTVLAAITFALIVGSAVAFIALRLTSRSSPADTKLPPVDRSQRATWRTPPLATLPPYRWSPSLRLAMVLLRGYLVLCVVLLVVKIIQLGHT